MRDTGHQVLLASAAVLLAGTLVVPSKHWMMPRDPVTLTAAPADLGPQPKHWLSVRDSPSTRAVAGPETGSA